MIVLCFYFDQPVDVQSLGDIFYRYSMQIEFRERNAIFLEVGQGQNLYCPENVVQRCLIHLKNLNLNPRWALAPDVPTALCFAKYRVQQKEQIPLVGLTYYAVPFKEDAVLQKHVGVIVKKLERLGCITFQDLKHVKSAGMLARFGALGGLLARQREDASGLVWRVFIPTQVVCEAVEFDFESPVSSSETLIFSLKTLIDRMHLRLRGQGKRLKTFRITLKLEYNQNIHPNIIPNIKLRAPSQRILDISLANGIISPPSILSIVRERLSHEVQARPLPHAVSHMDVLVLETTPDIQVQRDLFYPKKEEQEESYTSLISRLRIRLGKEAVFMAEAAESFIPELSWSRKEQVQVQASVRAKKTAGDVNGEAYHETKNIAIPARPLRLFHEPVKVPIIQGQVRWESSAVQVLRDVDREVILSEWWRGITERVYFRALTERGEMLWLFRNECGVFVHGIFD